MTIESSKHVDRLKTWGCGFAVAIFVVGALALGFLWRGTGGTGAHDEGDLLRRMERVEQRLDELERK